VADVTHVAPRESDEALDALLGPHRAFLEGRAALETLEADRVAGARRMFERVVQGAPELAAAHIGMANACVMHFEMTRADPEPDVEALALATHHAREACRLDPQSAEAWATRVRAAHRALELLPDFPLAHWLAAAVHVARQAQPQAARELEAGLAADAAAGISRFGAVAL
jgi:thioredoxin-like negative regulator of GroEL